MQLPDDIALRFLSRPVGAEPELDRLSEAERAQVDTFGSEKRRREFTLGRVAARELLGERLGLDSAEVPLRVRDDGAPEIAGGAHHVSISHVATEEHTLAVAVAAPRRIGVDLELIRPRRPDLFRFLLAPEDYGLLDTLPYSHDASQVLIWTLKEAVLKAMRTGFRVSPKKLRLTVDGDGARVAYQDEAWNILYEQRDACFLAIAYVT